MPGKNAIYHATLLFCLCAGWVSTASAAAQPLTAEANRVVEVSLDAGKTYPNPLMDVTLDAVVTRPDGKELRIPAFWAGGNRWCFRYASNLLGQHAWRTECSDKTNANLHGSEGKIEVVAYTGDNPLYRHGPIRVADDHRHFAHADGTPFFWLGDTWWKGLCKRLTWEGFQELTADRKAKGFTVVQIVCGVYPDEGLFEPRWENEGGMPYLTKDFSVVNPKYFEYADRRIQHLVDAGIAPAIVGGWGRADCNGMLVGIEGGKRHWRNLIARYGAYPAIWIIGGESNGPQWTEVAKYVHQTDPYHHPSTMHPIDSARNSVTDETAIDFDMLQTGHGDWDAARGAIPKLAAAYARKPPMPVMIGEYCYEGHMQTAFQDVQRYVFWASMLSGSAGLTYGAAGVWHASIEGDPGIANVYDFTTWREGMNYPGSTQLGLGKKLLEKYPWWRFEPHPEWVEPGCFAAGIPGEVRCIFLPRRGVYNWSGQTVKNMERGVPYSVFYFNPTNGKQYDQGVVINIGPLSKIFEVSEQSKLYEDRFENADSSAWRDYGSPTERKDGRLVGGKGMATVLEKIHDADVMAGVDANSDAEAGIILRFHDADNYLVAIYSPLLKSIFFHDRKDGNWDAMLGKTDVPEVGPKIRLTAAACGNYAAMALTDGRKTYYTPIVKVGNAAPGKAGLWLFQIGERQEFGNFALSRANFVPGMSKLNNQANVQPCSDIFGAPSLPSPQDWVLVLERIKL